MKDITPDRFKCGIGTCPAVFEKPDGKLVIVGLRVSAAYRQNVGVGEEAIEIDAGLLENAIRKASGLHDDPDDLL